MLRIVLPLDLLRGFPANVAPVCRAANWLIRRAVATNIRVTIEIVVADVVVTPTAAHPAAAPKCPHRHAHTE